MFRILAAHARLISMTSGVALLREIVDSCTDAEKKAAEYLLAEPKTAVFCTVAELARRADTSAPAVVRLCKRAGLSGYRELQLLFAHDLYAPASPEEPAPDFELDSSRSVEEIASDLVERSRKSFDRVLALVKPQVYEEVADAIVSARAIAVFGLASSGLVASDLAQKLVRVGLACSFSFDSAVQVSAACGLRAGDLAIAVSYSGRTPSVLQCAREAKASGARLVAITTPGSNPLARMADLVLPTPATESFFRLDASLSRATQFLVVDILYSTLVSRNIEMAMPRIERSMRATHLPERSGK
jgi:DNA-binding MurR/RpiR family transcriptional regulator